MKRDTTSGLKFEEKIKINKEELMFLNMLYIDI